MNEIQQFKQLLQQKMKELKKLKTKVERALKKAPEGKLVLSTSKGTTQYYLKNGTKKGEYIRKSKKKLIMALAQKDYDERLLKEIEERIKKIEKTCEWIPEKGLDMIYEKLSPARRALVKPYVLTDEQYVEQWKEEKYIEKGISEQTTFFVTEQGEHVRSKSEKIIADKLYSMGIPYKYECPLELPGYGVIYPDFTILDILNRKEVYLEHLGMMDDPDYCNKAILKLQNYARYGFFIGKELLITFESKTNPLSTIYLEELMKEYFF